MFWFPRRSDRIFRRVAGEEFEIMGRIGLPELLIILAIIVIIFGANRLPGLGRGIGSAIKNFKDGMKDETANHKS